MTEPTGELAGRHPKGFGQTAPTRSPDAHSAVRELRERISTARSVPMSTSVVVHRDELLRLVDQLSDALPPASTDADVGEVSAEILAEARQERERLIDQTDVLHGAREQADALLAAAQAEAAALRRETDDYVDAKLANLQVALTKTLEAVNRGRDRLQGRSELSDLGANE